jgi:phosphoribosylamine-glycine ligase
MRIQICSTGATLGLAYHLSHEGHTVSALYGTQGQIPGTFSSDISILDTINDPKVAEQLRNRGIKVLGADSWSRLLDIDSFYKHAVIRALDYIIAPPDTQGIRVTVSCLFNGNKFISKMLVFPYKRMMSCDVGVELDCSGFLTYFDVNTSKLVDMILTPLERFLKKVSHKGQFSVDCIVNKESVYVEDISASIFKPYITGVFENTRLSKSDILLRLFDANSSPITHIDPWSCGVLVSVSPYPHLIPKEPQKVTGFSPLNLKHLWLVDVVQDGDNWMCGANSGCLGYVTSRGVSIQEVSRRAYRTLSNIHVESIQYRSDIGKTVYEKYNMLKEAKLV